jgi:hypothetical protein
MKSYFLFVIILLFGHSYGYSQNAKDDTSSPETRATTLTTSMTCELGLDDPEQDVIQGINLEAYQQMAQAAKTYASNAKALDDAQAQIETDRNTKLKNNLSPRQWATYEKLSNGQSSLLNLTKACRKPGQDAYGF